MTLNESFNRTVNLVSVTVAALAGFAFAPEIGIEDKVVYKIDDILLFITGIAAIIWYRTGKNRITRSWVPLMFVAAGLAWKLMAVVVEIKEKDDVGDDFGGIVLFVCAFILTLALYKGTASLTKSAPAK